MTDKENTTLSEENLELEKPKTEKKRPGRPRKDQNVTLPNPKQGILNKPSDPRHLIEFLYDKPPIFKKIWSFFKLLSAEKIHMSFLPNKIVIYCMDHHKKSKIYVMIDCTQATHYYCGKELDIGLVCNNPGLVMGTIDKSYESILFLSNIDNSQHDIQILLTNKNQAQETHKIELISDYERLDDHYKFLDENYMVKFRLSGKYCKKMIADIKSFSEQATIKKDGPDENLMIEYKRHDRKIHSVHTFKKTPELNLRDNMGPEDTFMCTFKIDFVKPITSALLSDEIEIYADEDKPLKFIIQMDEAVKIIILTDIVDNRTETT
jgi:hypothetical protein